MTDITTPAAPRPVRILQVVGEMNRGGIETWLMHLMRKMNRQRFQMDFVIEGAEKATFDDEIRRLGGQIFNCRSRRSLMFSKRLRDVLESGVPYDVVHSHVNHQNGLVMRAASIARVPIRISHSHTDTTEKERSANWLRRRYVRLMQSWIAVHSTHGLAASVPAAISLFGSDWTKVSKWRVLHCGIDLAPFSKDHDRETILGELGIPLDAWVVGHVGRMVDVKNHSFTIGTFAEASRSAANAHLLLVGDGPLKSAILDQVQYLDISDRVHIISNRDDVPAILCSAIDTFIFPSKFEGLGLALIEAQAAGLPCLVSHAVPDEADVLSEQITRLRLEESWVPALLATQNFRRDPDSAIRAMKETDFCIERGVEFLERLYDSFASSGAPPEGSPAAATF